MTCKECLEIEKEKLDKLIDEQLSDLRNYLYKIDLTEFKDLEELAFEVSPICESKQALINNYIDINFHPDKSYIVNGVPLNTCSSLLRFQLINHFSQKYSVFHNLTQAYLSDSKLHIQ